MAATDSIQVAAVVAYPCQSHKPVNRNAALIALLDGAGIIPYIQTDLPRGLLSEIGDALLATPILATVVAMGNQRSLTMISHLQRRAHGHMQLGASNVRSANDVMAAVDAGAEFVLSPFWNAGVARQADRQSLAYLPGVLTAAEVSLARSHDYHLLYLTAADVLGPEHLRDLRTLYADCQFVIAGDHSDQDLVSFAEAGALAAVIDPWPHGSAAIPQAILIETMRKLRRLWEETKGRNPEILRLP